MSLICSTFCRSCGTCKERLIYVTCSPHLIYKQPFLQRHRLTCFFVHSDILTFVFICHWFVIFKGEICLYIGHSSQNINKKINILQNININILHYKCNNISGYSFDVCFGLWVYGSRCDLWTFHLFSYFNMKGFPSQIHRSGIKFSCIKIWFMILHLF